MTEANQKILNRLQDKLKKSEPIHISLPGNGLLKIEKPVPFLLVYRLGEGKDYFPNRLGKTESAYLIAEDSEDGLMRKIIQAVSNLLADKFNGFLIVETWLSPKVYQSPFTIHISQKRAIDTARKLDTELNKIPIPSWGKTSVIKKQQEPATPEAMQPLLKKEYIEKHGITFIGLEIAPVYVNEATGKPYPLFLRELRANYSKALRKSFFEFIRLQTSFIASHFQMLGTTIIDDKAREIDRELAAYTKLFDFLMLVTPINADAAWADFEKSNYARDPVFHYRPMPVDPELIKRKIYNLPIEEITDPTIAFLFRDKRKEIDRMLNMMQEREKHDFLLSSLQLFGPVSEQLLDVAKALLVAVDAGNEAASDAKRLTAAEFALMAQKELKWLRAQDSSISSNVRIADDIEGILVSKGVLNINSGFGVSKKRAQPLLQHEIGTHVVTYYNGKAQPLELFSIGVPGYEELQEGLAVLAEYMTGGLTASRMRTLAARVVAVQEMISGKSFVETFNLLSDKYAFTPHSAFNICMRVYRGGGLTKDAVYLKGFLNIIDYIRKGKDLKHLLIGKIREDYLPVVQELIHRNILLEAPITPRFLQGDFLIKLEAIKKDGNIFKMIQQ
ncbi:flavohemoglobin expression-modulating QEGLA motif protein [Niabella sp. 22666]|uniref:flavohemoglobin expression-modulating QEGLA motif protein n=1 Tax=Niabella sp. 22666 TaxID=3453954 RepID=UPI003F8799CA